VAQQHGHGVGGAEICSAQRPDPTNGPIFGPMVGSSRTKHRETVLVSGRAVPVAFEVATPAVGGNVSRAGFFKWTDDPPPFGSISQHLDLRAEAVVYDGQWTFWPLSSSRSHLDRFSLVTWPRK